MSPVKSIKRIPVHVWVPPEYHPLYRIVITRSDDSTDDITEEIFSGEITDGATDTIGNFQFSIDNSDERYTGVWTGNEVIRIYIDYATSATTLRFRGRIEKVSYRDNRITIKGRSDSKQLLDVTVTKAYTDTGTSDIIEDLFDTYATDFTYTNVTSETTEVTANWYQKPMFECILELCNSTGYDFYIDNALDAHYFESGSINNTVDAIIHENNLFEVGDFAYDQSLIKNRIIVYGADVGDLPLFKTAQDTTSIAAYGIKESIINDSNITTGTQCQERADYELSLSKDPPLVGDVSCFGLATIQPGENIQISAPASNLSPGYYKIMKYRHTFEGIMKTIVTIEKEPKNVYHVLRDRIVTEQKLTDTPNPNEMRYSWNFDFDTDTGTHTNTTIKDGVLKTEEGSTSGNWVSEGATAPANLTYFEIRAVGESLVGVKYYLSTNDGINWQEAPALKTEYAVDSPGFSIKLKVKLNSADTQIDGLALFYKT